MDNSEKTRPFDEKLHKLLVDFIRATVTFRQAYVLYSRNNVAFKEAEERWSEASEKVFEASEIIEMTVAGKNLFVGDILLELESPFVRDFVENLRKLIIRRISIKRGFDHEELQALIEMLSLDTRALLVKGGPAMFLSERGVRSIQVVENIYMKRKGLLGDLELETGEVNIDDLRFVSKQLKNFVSLRLEGMELRNQERELLAETGQHPTFMSELVKEMTYDEEGGGTPDDRSAQAEKISEILELLFNEMSRLPDKSDDFLSKALTGALMEIDEPLRLEVLAEQFKTAGQLPPVLKEEVFRCKPDKIAELVLNVSQRGESEMKEISSLLMHLIPDRDAFKRLTKHLKIQCKERGLDSKEIEELLKGTVGARLEAEADAEQTPEEAREVLQESLKRLTQLKKIGVDRAELRDYLLGGGNPETEVAILTELLRGGSASVKLVQKAAARIREFVKKAIEESACRLFRTLLEMPVTDDRELAKAIKREIRELCNAGNLRSILIAPVDGEEKAAIMVDILNYMASEEAARLWRELLKDEDSRVHDALAVAGSRSPQAVAELLRVLMADGRSDLVSRLTGLHSALPDEVSIPILKELCENPEPGVRLRAVSILGKVGGEQAIPILQSMLKDNSSDVRRTAIPLLGHLAGKAAVNMLLEIVADERGELAIEERALACRALSRCGDERAVPILAGVLMEKRRGRAAGDMNRLLTSARFALASIGGPMANKALKKGARWWTLFLRRILRRE